MFQNRTEILLGKNSRICDFYYKQWFFEIYIFKQWFFEIYNNLKSINII